MWPGLTAKSSSNTLYVHEGTSLALQCVATANPAAVSWTWRWRNASNATSAPASVSASLPVAISRDTAGSYSCEATNDVGSAAASISIVALCVLLLTLPITRVPLSGRLSVRRFCLSDELFYQSISTYP